MSINVLKDQRQHIISQMRQLLDKAAAEKRELTSEEDANYTRMNKDLDDTDEAIRRLQDGTHIMMDGPGTVSRSDWDPNGNKPRDVWNRFLLDGRHALTPGELRALQVDVNAGGGYLVAPQAVAGEVLRSLQDQCFALRPGFCKIITVANAQSLGVPTVSNEGDEPTWTAELGTGSEDSAMAFGKRELFPHPLAKRIKVSNKLLRASALAPESIVRDAIAYKTALAVETAFMTGSGSNQPLGIFTASDQGISTSRDVSTGNTTTSITADGLIEALYSLKGQYAGRSTWIFHRDAIKQIRKLKDGNGQYLWSPGITGVQPQTILDRPFLMSEYAPHTFTTGQYVGIVGDFSFYWFAVALQMYVQVLDQLYAETNQTGYISRMEIDGMPALEEAFVRVKLA
ncbi:MAG: phage major capsid protein [Acidobacteriota bacterium]|nr:phage major capsid protein [Acidobacteriota bacterium]